jgi:hypothetical protein
MTPKFAMLFDTLEALQAAHAKLSGAALPLRSPRRLPLPAAPPAPRAAPPPPSLGSCHADTAYAAATPRLRAAGSPGCGRAAAPARIGSCHAGRSCRTANGRHRLRRCYASHVGCGRQEGWRREVLADHCAVQRHGSWHAGSAVGGGARAVRQHQGRVRRDHAGPVEVQPAVPPMTAHDEYGASSAKRWTSCLRSVALCAQAPPSQDSEWGDEGKMAHELRSFVVGQARRHATDFAPFRRTPSRRRLTCSAPYRSLSTTSTPFSTPTPVAISP